MKSTNGVLEPMGSDLPQPISMISHHAQCGGGMSSTLPRNGHLQYDPQQQQFALLHGNGYYSTSTLPKPPLKGILKNNTSTTMLTNMPLEPDVIPFDNLPPCDDCMERARVEGSYSGVCDNQNCSMGNGTLRRRASMSAATTSSSSSGRLTNGFNPNSKGKNCAESFSTQLFPSDAFASTAFRGSQESLMGEQRAQMENGGQEQMELQHPIEDEEVLEQVESSV